MIIKTIKKISFAFYLTFMGLPIFSQKIDGKERVVIQGRLLGYQKGDLINYYLPIDGHSNYEVYNSTNVLSDSGDFKITVNLDSAGFILIQRNNGKVYILAKNGDSINFVEQAQPYPDHFAMQPVLFNGSNAEALYIYNKMNANLFYKFNYIRSLLEKTYPPKANLYDTLKVKINQYLIPFDSLYKEHKISKYYLNIIKSDFLNVMFSYMLSNFNVIEDYNAWIDEDFEHDFKKKVYMYAIYNDSYILHTNWGSSIITDFISNYDEIFSSKDFTLYDSFTFKNGRVYKNIAYLPPIYSKFQWGDALVIQKLLADDHREFSFDTIFTYYKKTYPQSAYIKIIQNLPNKNDSVANKNMNDNNIKIIDSLGTSNSLRNIVQQNFKSVPVLIDLWATWCMPCREEFKFKEQLDTVLYNRGIKLLYISQDLFPLKDEWIKCIYASHLNGYHVLASKELNIDISKYVYNNDSLQSIPRYVLFNKNGIMIDNNLPRPSDINLLRRRLDELLK